MFERSVVIQINKDVGESGRLLKPDVLDSAFASFGYYPDKLQGAVSVVRSIMQGHPFLDGNKRTGVVLLQASWDVYGSPIHKSDDEWVEFAVNSVVERWSVDQIVSWITQ